MFDLTNVTTIAQREIRDAVRNRWLQLDAAAFAVLAFVFSTVSLMGVGDFGYASFGKTAAGLVNLVIFIVPLMGLTTGAAAIAAEVERGTMGYLLAQPVSRAEVLLGKFTGLSVALAAALALGFGVAGVALWANGVQADPMRYAVLVGYSFLLAISMLSVGILVSVASPRGGVATASAIFIWLGLAFLTDLGLIGGAMAFRVNAPELFGLSLANPLQSFKLAVLSSIHSSLDVLGPAGTYAVQTFGSRLNLLFLVSLLGWILIPFLGAHFWFERRAHV